MSTTRTITIGSVATKSGTTNGKAWRRYSLLDPDDKFVGSTLNERVGAFIQAHEGQRVEVDVEEKQGERGTLRDLLDAREVAAEPTISPTEKHSTIIREVALKAAVEFTTHAAAITTDDDKVATVEDVLIIADKFSAWIASGQS